jgi:hypothetical protein
MQSRCTRAAYPVHVRDLGQANVAACTLANSPSRPLQALVDAVKRIRNV